MLFGKYIEIIAHMKTYYVNHTQKIVTPCHTLHLQYDVGECLRQIFPHYAHSYITAQGCAEVHRRSPVG